ncbi:unnamed protein product [Coffea canephora]|uniref:DH200=94 genomic scaffold, scaffold_2984 n=1 Tax=Coffea canephora TaxID=49390 RepID=A0A068VL00_COFCA|nr:unnamed protein product [Coffea canephora]
MQSVYSALCSLNLQDKVSITTAHSLAVLQTSYLPFAGRFHPDLTPCLTAILNFHLKTGSPFLINVYPYFAYKANPKQVPLEFVLFQPNSGILNSFRIPLFALYLDDPATNLHYDNMLFAQIDAVHFAVEFLGFKDDAVCVQISETGWPSKGDADEAGATPENAKKYNGNLINKLVCGKKGTPMRPNADLNIYVFALFNENMKSSPTSERNYGLFKPDDSSAYYTGFNSTGLLSTSSNTSSPPSSTGSSSSSSSSVPPGSSSSSSGSTTSSTAVVVS